MPELATQTQGCPACGKEIEIGHVEPLRRIQCPHCGESIRVQPTFGNFQVVEALGSGGMGNVYKARDVQLGREVALKVLRQQGKASAEQQAQLQEEARLTASINHPNVVRVYSSGTAHRQFYIVMELVEGGSLDDAIEERKKIPEEEALGWGIQIARGLEAAREAGLLHRDIKPGNILFADPQTPKIVDFGLAGVAQAGNADAGAIWGTPYYVAPERLERIPEDHRSDIYSLAATLFHALAGKPPIDAETNSAAQLRQLKNSPPDLREVANVSAVTAAAIKRALQPKPEDRTASYAALIEDLQNGRRSLEESREKAEARAGRHKRILKWAGVGFVTAAVVTGATLWIVSQRAERQRALAAAREAAMAPHRARFAEATGQIARGDFARAEKVLSELATINDLEQPLANFARMHLALVSFLQNKLTEARSVAATIQQETQPVEDIALDDSFRTLADLLRTRTTIAPSDVEQLQIRGLGFLTAAAQQLTERKLENAQQLLDAFIKGEPTGPDAQWTVNYKPLAEKLRQEISVAREAQKNLPGMLESGDFKRARATMEKARSGVSNKAIGQMLADHEQQIRLEEAQWVQQQARDRERITRELLPLEKPVWAKALTEYRKHVAAMDFSGARDAIASVEIEAPPLVAEKEWTLQKADWLLQWKEQLISAIKARAAPAPKLNLLGATAEVVSATPERITLQLPYGTSELTWDKISPPTLLELAEHYARASGSNAASAPWLNAVFAAETGQTEKARALADAAMKARPELRKDAERLLEAR